MTERKPIFRQEALERLSSPERLDQLVQIIKPQDWLLFLTIVAIVAAALFWCVYGRVPLTVSGEGILLSQLNDNPMPGGSAQSICRTYFAVRDGKRIQPGMQAQVMPDTVKQEQFGGIVGTVQQVSEFPVSRDTAATSLGKNADLAVRLLADPPCIEVVIRLEGEPRNPSGFRWTSSAGPPAGQVSEGITTTARVTLEQRTPISFLLPFLRSVSGIY